MTNMLNALFFRLRKMKLLWILLAVLVALSIADTGLYQVILDMAGGDMGDLSMILGGDTFVLSMSAVAKGDSYSAILTVIFVALFIGADFSDGTLRNAVLANKGRWQIFAAYTIVSLVVSLGFVAVQTIVYVIYLAFAGVWATYAPSVVLTGLFSGFGIGVVTCWAVAMMTLLTLVLFKKKSLAIILPLVVVIVLSAVLEVYYLLSLIAGSNAEVCEWIPFIQQMLFDASLHDGALLGKILLTNSLLSIVLGAVGGLVFAKAELK